MADKPETLLIPDNPAKAAEIKIESVNWPEAFPYKPDVRAKIWHDGDNLHILYKVDEEHVAALAARDNGEVWKDSCVEFFVSFDDNGYYNLETNCAGKVLLSHRTGRKENVEYAPESVLNAISRNPSLGDKPFGYKRSSGPWSLELTVPVSTFFKHGLKSFKGVDARCNIYKCGDELPKPHFLSYFPIDTENPDFHRPEFFGPVRFS